MNLLKKLMLPLAFVIGINSASAISINRQDYDYEMVLEDTLSDDAYLNISPSLVSLEEIDGNTLTEVYGHNVQYSSLDNLNKLNFTKKKIKVPKDLAFLLIVEGNNNIIKNPEKFANEVYFNASKLGYDSEDIKNLKPKEAINLAADIVTSKLEYETIDLKFNYLDDLFEIGKGDCDVYSGLTKEIFNLFKKENPRLENVYVGSVLDLKAKHAYNNVVLLTPEKAYFCYLDPTLYRGKYGLEAFPKASPIEIFKDNLANLKEITQEAESQIFTKRFADRINREKDVAREYGKRFQKFINDPREDSLDIDYKKLEEDANDLKYCISFSSKEAPILYARQDMIEKRQELHKKLSYYEYMLEGGSYPEKIMLKPKPLQEKNYKKDSQCIYIEPVMAPLQKNRYSKHPQFMSSVPVSTPPISIPASTSPSKSKYKIPSAEVRFYQEKTK